MYRLNIPISYITIIIYDFPLSIGTSKCEIFCEHRKKYIDAVLRARTNIERFAFCSTVTALERALNNIGRDDIVEKCNFAEIGHYPSQHGVRAQPEQIRGNYIEFLFPFFLASTD